MSRKKTVPYEEGLNERLKDSAYAAESLNAHLAEDDDHAVEAFLLALRDIATAHGFASVAKKQPLAVKAYIKGSTQNEGSRKKW